MRPRFLVAFVLAALAACSSGDEGPSEPQIASHAYALAPGEWSPGFFPCPPHPAICRLLWHGDSTLYGVGDGQPANQVTGLRDDVGLGLWYTGRTKWDMVGGNTTGLHGSTIPDPDHAATQGHTAEAGQASALSIGKLQGDVIFVRYGDNDLLNGRTGAQTAAFVYQIVANHHSVRSSALVVVIAPPPFTQKSPRPTASHVAEQAAMFADFAAHSWAYNEAYLPPPAYTGTWQNLDGIHETGDGYTQRAAAVLDVATQAVVADLPGQA